MAKWEQLAVASTDREELQRWLRAEKFLKIVRDTPTTVEEWAKQKHVYTNPKHYSETRLGFATFYLNRCNRSGIIKNGGPIGGQQQTGNYKIDAQYNREELSRRISTIAIYADRISVTNLDAIELLKTRAATLKPSTKPFVYLDPPYYAKGRDLYLNFYTHEDHAKLAAFMAKQTRYPWIISYDNVPQIAKLYKGMRQVRFSVDYSARDRREGRELMIFRPETRFPASWVRSIPQRFITSADDGPSLPI
jgi:DNA adenine methylase